MVRTMEKNKEQEITRIVCFCAFNDSSVVEYLQKEQSYLLKLCRDPDSLEQMVDTVHPEIILVDCTKKSSSGAAKPHEVIELSDIADSEDLIELPDIACSDDLAVLQDTEASASGIYDMSVDERSQCNRTPDELVTSAQAADNQSPSATLMVQNYLSDHLSLWDIAHKGEIIFIFDNDPGMEFKVRCLENRCDFMVAPFPIQELDFKIRLHANQKELNQRVLWQKATLNRAVEHIDKLKQIIFATQDEFSREKELLYNSLKQINMMSSEREILKRELRSSRVKLTENIRGINDFLCSMVESRSEYKKGHSKRVAEISEFVAEKIGLQRGAVKTLKKAAMLHEVGMLLIPTSILNKEPSQLSDYEQNMLMLHPSNGAAYLERCPGFEKIAGIIRHLHENSDGTGLPEGLKKRYIPLASKVLAGADLLDQIWIDTPHASVERLLELLEEYSGSRLDPSIVNLLEQYVVTVLNDKIDKSNIMLKEIAVYQLKPGMVTGSGLFTKTGTKLFSPGTTLTEELIGMLEKYTREYPVNETVFIKVDL